MLTILKSILAPDITRLPSSRGKEYYEPHTPSAGHSNVQRSAPPPPESEGDGSAEKSTSSDKGSDKSSAKPDKPSTEKSAKSDKSSTRKSSKSTEKTSGEKIPGSSQSSAAQQSGQTAAPTWGQRTRDTLQSVVENSASNLTDAARTLYQVGQPARTARDSQQRQEIQRNLDQAKYAMEILLQDGADSSDLQSQQSIIDHYQRQLDAFSTVLDGAVQSLAAQQTAQLADRLEVNSMRHNRQAKQGLDTLGQLGLDALALGANFLGDLGTSAVIPGGGLLSQGVNSFGAESRRARQHGADLTQQLAAGLASAAIDLAAEKLANAAPSTQRAYDDGLLDDVLNNLADHSPVSALGKVQNAALSEGSEAFLQSLSHSATQHMIYDPQSEIDVKDAFQLALLGAALGGVTAGVSSLLSRDDAFLNGFFSEERRQNSYVPDDPIPQGLLDNSIQADYNELKALPPAPEDLAPQSLDDLLPTRADTDLWDDLQERQNILDMYEVNQGSLSESEILNLHKICINEKRNYFNSRCKRSGNFAGAYLDGDPTNMYYAHSKISIPDDSKNYKGSAHLVLMKDDPSFSYIAVPKKDGTLRKSTRRDTEAKLFEYFSDLYQTKPFTSITMLSERGMCDSCLNVMRQFQERFPDVTINVVSNKEVIGDVWKNLD